VPPPQRGRTAPPSTAPPSTGGAKVLPLKVLPLKVLPIKGSPDKRYPKKEKPTDTNSDSAESALIEAPFSEAEARAKAVEIYNHETAQSQRSFFHAWPPEECEELASSWWVNGEKDGWRLNGGPMGSPDAALRKYIRIGLEQKTKRNPRKAAVFFGAEDS